VQFGPGQREYYSSGPPNAITCSVRRVHERPLLRHQGLARRRGLRVSAVHLSEDGREQRRLVRLLAVRRWGSRLVHRHGLLRAPPHRRRRVQPGDRRRRQVLRQPVSPAECFLPVALGHADHKKGAPPRFRCEDRPGPSEHGLDNRGADGRRRHREPAERPRGVRRPQSIRSRRPELQRLKARVAARG
jgi:hypothetical protein